MSELLEQVINKVKQLPQSEQERIARMVLKELERQDYGADYSFYLENQPFVGMWKDRHEMQNSSEWVRQIRREQW